MRVLEQKPEWDGQKLLLIHFGSVGELLALTPAFAALHVAYPAARLEVLTIDGTPVLLHNQEVDIVHTLASQAPGAVFSMLKTLRLQHYFAILCFSSTNRLACMFTRHTPAAYKVAFFSIYPRKQKAFTHLVHGGDAQHYSLHLMQAMENIGVPMASYWPVLALSPQTQMRIQLEYPRASAMRLAVFPGPAKDPQIWDAEKFVRLIEQLHAHFGNSLEIVLILRDQDKVLQQVFASIPDTYYALCFVHTFQEAAALLQTCDRLVASSLDAVLLANAVQTSVTALFNGPTANMWQPLGQHDACVRPTGLCDASNVQEIHVPEVLESLCVSMAYLAR